MSSYVSIVRNKLESSKKQYKGRVQKQALRTRSCVLRIFQKEYKQLINSLAFSEHLASI